MNHVRSPRYGFVLLLGLLLAVAARPTRAALPPASLNGVVYTATGSVQLAPPQHQQRYQYRQALHGLAATRAPLNNSPQPPLALR